MAGKTVSLYIDKTLLEWIDDEAKKEFRNRSNMLDKILREARGVDCDHETVNEYEIVGKPWKLTVCDYCCEMSLETKEVSDG